MKPNAMTSGRLLRRKSAGQHGPVMAVNVNLDNRPGNTAIKLHQREPFSAANTRLLDQHTLRKPGHGIKMAQDKRCPPWPEAAQHVL